MIVRVPSEVATHILNNNRNNLSNIEKTHEVKINMEINDKLILPHYEIEILNNYSNNGKEKAFKVASDAITGSDFMRKDNSEYINIKVSEEEMTEYNKDRKEDFKNFTSNKRHNRGKRGGSNRNNRNNYSKNNRKNYTNNKPNVAPAKKGLLKKLFG
jgi:hypothetical protein